MKPLGIFAAIVAVFVFIGFGSFNSLVTKDEAVDGAWSEVQNQMVRRNDLIPNLVATVQGYAAHESEVFAAVTEARSRVAGSVNIDASALANNPQLQQQLLQAQQGLTASLGRLIAVAEAYPDLKASENFVRLQDELAGTENRIAVARKRAIEATRNYNSSIRRIPGRVIASFVDGFAAKEYYEAPEGTNTVPVVNFN